MKPVVARWSRAWRVFFVFLATAVILPMAGGFFAMAADGDGGPPRQQRPLPQLAIILDGSITMEDELAGELKYKLVRRAFARILPAHGGRLRTALYSFGLNETRSCKDISRVVRMKTLQPASMSLVINNIRPKGRSPVSAALARVVNNEARPDQPLDILLLADGGDNCHGDVCATAGVIASRLPLIRIHVIGLGHNGPTRSLACIAKATHGVFSLVGDRKQLAAALEMVMRTARRPRKAADMKTAAMAGEASLSPQKTASQARRHQLPPPPLPESRKIALRHYKQAAAKSAAHARQPAAPRKKARQKALTIGQNMGRNGSRNSSGSGSGNAVPSAISTLKAGKTQNRSAIKTQVANHIRPKAPAPDTATQPAAPQTTAALASPQPAINGKARISLSALVTEEGGVIEKGLTWRLYKTSGKNPDKLELIEKSSQPVMETSLDPGIYLVNLAWGRSHLSEKINIVSARPIQKRLVLNAGGLKLAARRPDGSPISSSELNFRIYSDERDQFGKRKLLIDNAPAGKVIRLNAGIYHLESRYGSVNGVVESDVTVEAGKLVKVTINHNSPRVTFKLVKKPGGDALAGTIWRILSPEGKLLKESAGALPSHILAAGEYTIEAHYGGRIFARKVRIEPGGPVHVELVIQ